MPRGVVETHSQLSQFFVQCLKSVHQFQAIAPLLNPLKISENVWLLDFLEGIEME